MDTITWNLYFNSFIYYIIMFICPFVFVEPCGGGVNPISHMIYLVYALLSGIFEVRTVFRIQNKVNDERVLKFNKWHWVELLMGQIARFDTYLDVCFLNLLLQCSVWKLVIPVMTLILLYITYPLTSIFRLMKL